MEETKKPEELSQENLEQISGGGSGGLQPSGYCKYVVVIRTDSRGNATHWQEYRGNEAVGAPFHYVCPHCGRLLHEGFLGRKYCDPCDEGWMSIHLQRTNGIYPGC